MKRLGLFFVVFLCLSVFFVPNKSFATHCPDEQQVDGPGGTCVDREAAINETGENNTFQTEYTGAPTGALPNAKPLGTSPPGGKEASCPIGLSMEGLNCLIGSLIKVTLLEIAGFILWLTANLLDYSIRIGILNFSTWAPATLYPLWQIVRQIVSLCIVFTGLYMGFMYIIKSDIGERFLKRYIPWLVLFALFVNFSYPISRAAIDISNIISLNIYNQAVPGALSGTGENTAGAQIMDKLGLQGLIFSTSGLSEKGGADSVSKINGTGGALMAVVYVLYAAYIFGFAAFLMIIRNITLVFGIIGSPLLFVDAVVPKFGEAATKFRIFFFEQLALSIVFMIMLYFSIAVMKVFTNPDIINKSGGSIATMFSIAIMLITLHIMLKVTLSFSGDIGKAVEGIYKTAAMGVAGGGMAMAGRATIGRAAAAVGNSQWMQDNKGGRIGGMLNNVSTTLSNNTFDARNSGAVRALAGMGGIDMGNVKGTTKTYTGNLEAKQKAFATKYNGMNEKARAEFADRTINSKLNLVGGEGVKIASEALYQKYESLDPRAKQAYFNRQETSVQAEIMGRDKKKAELDLENIDWHDTKDTRDNAREMKKRREEEYLNAYRNEKDPNKKRLMYANADEERQEKMNAANYASEKDPTKRKEMYASANSRQQRLMDTELNMIKDRDEDEARKIDSELKMKEKAVNYANERDGNKSRDMYSRANDEEKRLMDEEVIKTGDNNIDEAKAEYASRTQTSATNYANERDGDKSRDMYNRANTEERRSMDDEARKMRDASHSDFLEEQNQKTLKENAERSSLVGSDIKDILSDIRDTLKTTQTTSRLQNTGTGPQGTPSIVIPQNAGGTGTRGGTNTSQSAMNLNIEENAMKVREQERQDVINRRAAQAGPTDYNGEGNPDYNRPKVDTSRFESRTTPNGIIVEEGMRRKEDKDDKAA